MASANEIPPGGEGEIKVTFSTDLDAGKKVKSIKVMTNAPRAPSLRLVVTADIQPALICDPRVLDFGKLTSSEGKTMKAKITGYAFGQIQIQELLSEDPLLQAEIIEDGTAVQVTLLPGHPVGRLSQRLKFLTNDPKMRLLTALSISARITGPIQLSTGLVDFPEIPNGEVVEKVVEVRTISETTFEIKDVTINNDDIKSRIETVEEGRVYKVVLMAAKDFDNARVDLSLSSPEQPMEKIMLFGKGK